MTISPSSSPLLSKMFFSTVLSTQNCDWPCRCRVCVCVCVNHPVHCGFQEWLGCVCVLQGEAEALWTWKLCSLQLLNWRASPERGGGSELWVNCLLCLQCIHYVGGSPGTQPHPAGTTVVCRLLKWRSTHPRVFSSSTVPPGPPPVL